MAGGASSGAAALAGTLCKAGTSGPHAQAAPIATARCAVLDDLSAPVRRLSGIRPHSEAVVELEEAEARGVAAGAEADHHAAARAAFLALPERAALKNLAEST